VTLLYCFAVIAELSKSASRRLQLCDVELLSFFPDVVGRSRVRADPCKSRGKATAGHGPTSLSLQVKRRARTRISCSTSPTICSSRVHIHPIALITCPIHPKRYIHTFTLLLMNFLPALLGSKFTRQPHCYYSKTESRIFLKSKWRLGSKNCTWKSLG
jgi:hypothetical protein